MLIQSILSYDSNILLAAIISLLLVILFILLLHVYAKWFLVHARRRSRNSVDSVLGPSRLRHFNTYNLDTALFAFPSKGLEASAIALIPVFVYEPADDEQRHHGLECVVCLSVFEEGEVGRKLPKCGHGFHVECIDMWLSSHSSCPICRAPAAAAVVTAGTDLSEDERVISRVNRGEHELEVVVEVPSSDENENENENIVIGTSDSSSSSSPSSSLSSQAVALGGTLKRMLSKKSDCKVHPSAAAAAAVSEMDNI